MGGRFYLAPVVGAGTDADPYRAKTEDLGVPYVASIPSRANGTPRHSWALVRAASRAVLNNDPDHLALPNVPLSTPWTSLPQNARTNALAAISDRFGLSYVPDPEDTLGDVVRALGRALDGPQFQPASMVDG